MSKSSVLIASAAITLLTALAGCNSDPAQDPKPARPAIPLAPASTQPAPLVAEMGALKISRSDLDSLLYESYGLRMMFDLVELNLAKATLLAQQGQTLLPADVQRERKIIMDKLTEGAEGASPADAENLFEQLLQREHISRAEFEIKVVQTDACLRKIIEPIVVGKLPEEQVKRAFEQLYGAKRKIADITLGNVRDATLAHNLCLTQPFGQVAMQMSIDTDTARNGGVWPPFSFESKEIPEAILTAAFTTDPGKISDILTTGTTYHIIKVLEVIPPKIVKYEDEKDSVRKQLEDKLIDADIKRLREALTEKAQAQVQIDDPILRAQWDEMLAKSRPRSADPNTVKKQMDDQLKQNQSATMPSTTPGSVHNP